MSETKEVAGLVERMDKLAAWLDIKSMPGGSGDCREAAREIERLTAERDAARETVRLNAVWDLPADIQAITVKLEAAEAAVSTLTRQLEEAGDALEPFAKAGEVKLCGNFRDDERCAMTDAAAHLTFGDLRRAAAIRSLKQGAQ